MSLWDKILGMFSSDRPQPPERRLGRNEPCWCGSGKKYKKCHFREDEKKRSRALAAACQPGKG